MKRLVILLLFVALGLFLSVDVEAQCAMCKAGAESSVEGGSTKSAGINKAILYLMAFPYVMGVTFGLLWFRNKRRKNRELAAQAI